MGSRACDGRPGTRPGAVHVRREPGAASRRKRLFFHEKPPSARHIREARPGLAGGAARHFSAFRTAARQHFSVWGLRAWSAAPTFSVNSGRLPIGKLRRLGNDAIGTIAAARDYAGGEFLEGG